MSRAKNEVAAYEERLRLAVMAPDSSLFEELLADNAVLWESAGAAKSGKASLVEAHHAGKGSVFSTVQMINMQIVDHGDTAVVTCRGIYVREGRTMTLKFMRVWMKKSSRWQIIAATVLR